MLKLHTDYNTYAWRKTIKKSVITWIWFMDIPNMKKCFTTEPTLGINKKVSKNNERQLF